MGTMDRRTRHSTRVQAQDSDPESGAEDPTASGGLPEFSGEGLEQLQHVATEIIEGAARIEQLGMEHSDREQEDDVNESRHTSQKSDGNELSDHSDGAGGCGGTPTGIVRERFSWQPADF